MNSMSREGLARDASLALPSVNRMNSATLKRKLMLADAIVT
jgi:hypothetical protein